MVGVLAWLGSRKLELTLLLLGILLRTSMAWNYDARWSYDSPWHWEVVEWIAKHKRVPYPEFTFESQHPPVYYAIAAWLTTLGVSRQQMAWLSIVPSCLELIVIWIGLELYIPRSRLARVAALALASVTSALIHLGGMVYPESLSCFLNALVLLLIPLGFRRSGSDRWPRTITLGVILGIAMLTKVSASAVILGLGMGVAFELFGSGRPLGFRIRNAAPWTAAVVVCVAIAGWYFARNVREYGKPFITTFDLPAQHYLVEQEQKKKFLDRRSLGFFFQWDNGLFVHPFGIQNQGAHARLVPVAVASTFEDYWGYGFQGYERPFATSRKREQREQSATTGFARAALAGGLIIFFATATAWLMSFALLARRRDFGRLALLFIPLATLIASVQFATENPADGVGVVKGIYMSFGSLPLYGLFGLAVGWAGMKRERMPVLLLLVAALWCVGAYSIFCRLGLRLLPV
jgi:hypothetical protein